MPIIKTLSKAAKAEKEKFTIPKSVQDAIPIQRVWPDGIFQVGSRFSKTFSFTDINYQIASKEDKTAMFLDYSELLNALDSGASAKITINNRKVNKEEFEKSLLLPMREDGLDHYRKEYNEMLLSKATGTNNSVVQDRYITITVAKRNIDEARTYFSRVGTDLITHLSQLSSIGRELDIGARLQIFRDFFKGNEPAAFAFDLKEHMKKGHSFKDWLCPDSMEFQKDHFRLNDRWGRVLYLQGYASYIKDSMIAELCDMDRSLMLSIDILAVPTDEAVREIQNKLLGVETNAANWQRKQNAANNFSAVLPYDMEQQRKETKEMLEDLTSRDQRMMFGLVTLVHLVDTKEQLDSDTETLLITARKHLCQMSVLRWQQKDGLDTVLPYGLRKIQTLRTLTTESTAVLIPFRAQEILQNGGIYYGQNAVSKNMIVADRRKLLNGNSFRLGVSGSGKSFSAKEEIVNIALSTNDDILILDPESEFGFLVEALGGEVIRVSASSDTHLNAMDMDKAYGDERNPLIEKSELILSLFEQLVGAGNVSAKEKSILDRCTYDSEENKKAYDLSQKQRTMEARIRRTKSKLAGLRVAGMAEEYNKAARLLERQNTAYQEFCRENNLKPLMERIQAAQWTREDARRTVMEAGSKSGLKKPSPRATINDMEKQNVTREYLDAAAPGQGSVSYQKGYKPGEHKKEIQMAEWLYNTFGGDVSLLTESKEPGDKTPDFLWNGKSWELKGVSGKSSVDRAVRDAAKQIQVNTGGIILDCSASVLPTEDIESIVSQRARRVALDSVDVLFVSDSKIKKVLRYTKK